MTHGIKTIIYPVKDLAAAKAQFDALLGVEPYMANDYYVGYKVDGQDIGLDPSGHQQGLGGPTPYLHVDDIAVTVARLEGAGANVKQAVKDVGGGKLTATLVDAQGNIIGLVQEAARKRT